MLDLPIPNMLNGVSQQPPQVRFPNQCEELLNGIPSPSESLIKRYPTEHVVDWPLTALDLGADPKALLHIVDRGDGEEAYGLVIHRNGVRAWDLNRRRDVPVTGTFGYLSSVQDPVQDVSLVTIGDYTLVSNRNETVGMTALAGNQLDPPLNQAIFWVNAANYSTNFKVTVQAYRSNGTSIGSFSASFMTAASSAAVLNTATTVDTETFTNQASLSGTYIAAQLKVALETARTDLPAGNTLKEITFTRGPGNYAVAVGRTDNSVGKQLARILVTVSDGMNGNGLKTLDSATSSGSLLPNICVTGLKVQVIGDNEDSEDDYWLEFVGKSPSGISEGYWIESVAPNIPTALNKATVPHALIRKFYQFGDTIPSGSTLGDPYFAFVPLDGSAAALGIGWGSRTVGDEGTNPDPSFVGNRIQSMFMFQGRLGFLSGEAVCLSRSGEFFEFFRKTVRNLLDTEPIDVLSAYPQVTEFTQAVPLESNLVLFSSKVQMILSSPDTEVLTPRTATLQPVSQHDCEPFCRPALVDQEIFFPFTRSGPFIGIRDMVVSSTNLQAVVAPEITAHVPRYIPGRARVLQASPNDRTLAVLSEADASSLYIYNWFNSEEGRVQSAWSRWTFTDFSILSAGWLSSRLILLTKENGNLGRIGLREMDLRHGRTDDESRICVRLDSRKYFPDSSGSLEIGEVQAESPPTQFSLSTAVNLLFGVDASSGNTVTVTAVPAGSTDPWQAISSADWITLNNASGTGSGSFTFDVSQNSSNDNRSGAISIPGYENAVLLVSQLGAGQALCTQITLSPPNTVIGSSGGTAALLVDANAACSWNITSPDDSFLTLSASSGTGPATVNVTASDNALSLPRVGTVIVTIPSTQASAQATITQAAAPPPDYRRPLLPTTSAGVAALNPRSPGDQAYHVAGIDDSAANLPLIGDPEEVLPGVTKVFPTALYRYGGGSLGIGQVGHNFGIAYPFTGESSDFFNRTSFSFPTYPQTRLVLDFVYRRSLIDFNPITQLLQTLQTAEKDTIFIRVGEQTSAFPVRVAGNIAHSTIPWTVRYPDGNLINDAYGSGSQGQGAGILWTAPAYSTAPITRIINGVQMKIGFSVSWAPLVTSFGSPSPSLAYPTNKARGVRGHISIEIVSSPDPENLRLTSIVWANEFTNLTGSNSVYNSASSALIQATRGLSNTTLFTDDELRNSPRVRIAYSNFRSTGVFLNNTPSQFRAQSLESDRDPNDRFVYASGPRAGQTVPEISRVTNPATGKITVTLDSDGSPVFYGKDYTFLYRFSQPYLRPGDTTSALTTGRFQVRAINLNYEDSGPFRAEVVPKNSSVYSRYMYDRGSTVNSSYVDQALDTGTMRIPVMSAPEQVTVDVINDTPYPSKLVSASIEASYDSRSRRV
jgi:hypothetical protein